MGVAVELEDHMPKYAKYILFYAKRKKYRFVLWNENDTTKMYMLSSAWINYFTPSFVIIAKDYKKVNKKILMDGEATLLFYISGKWTWVPTLFDPIKFEACFSFSDYLVGKTYSPMIVGKKINNVLFDADKKILYIFPARRRKMKKTINLYEYAFYTSFYVPNNVICQKEHSSNYYGQIISPEIPARKIFAIHQLAKRMHHAPFEGKILLWQEIYKILTQDKYNDTAT